jgi:hypothetical protein
VLENFAGTYTPFSGWANPAPEDFDIFAMEKNGLLYEASSPEYGDLVITVATLGGQVPGWLPWPSGSISQEITILNFVNGDLGINFAKNGDEVTGDSGTPLLAALGDPGNVYLFHGGTTIALGSSNSSSGSGSGSSSQEGQL